MPPLMRSLPHQRLRLGSNLQELAVSYPAPHPSHTVTMHALAALVLFPSFAVPAVSSTGQGAVAAPDFAVYRDSAINLEFRHPRTWVVLKQDSNKRRNDGETNFRITLNGGGEATLVVLRNRFGGSIEEWQEFLAKAAKSQKREIVRQWQQELMGSPMLLTRIKYDRQDVPMTELAGLFFNGSSTKLQFRLTSTAADSDKAEFEITQALETLKIADEKAKATGTPTAPGAPTAPEPDQVLDLTKPTRPKEYAPLAQELTISNRKIGFRYPKPWTVTVLTGGTLQIRHPDLPAVLSGSFYWMGDSDPSGRVLMRESAKTLAKFKSVTQRIDVPVAMNLAGCSKAIIWRTGTAEGGGFGSFDGAIATDDFFAIFSTTSNKPLDKGWRKLLTDFLDRVSIEARP